MRKGLASDKSFHMILERDVSGMLVEWANAYIHEAH